jgi:phage N-6-adenine-methyltransferase
MANDEKPDFIHGRLVEKLHISGYELERALSDLDKLLDGNAWKTLGNGFDDVDVFLKSLQLKTFHYTIEQRQSIVKKLGSIRGATQRAIGQAVGVSEATVNRDLNPVTNVTKPKPVPEQIQQVASEPVTNVTKPPSAQSGEAAAKAAEKAANTHVAHNSGENEWYTPSEYIEAARRSLGGRIDLDPASSEIANRIVKAETFYTKENSGLDKNWQGNVWMNPPYASDLIKQFCSKFAWHINEGSVKSGIVLVNNATETAWFRELVDCATAIVFTSGRVKFLDPQGNPGAPLQGQALIYCGEKAQAFVFEFKSFGWGAIL